MAKKEIKHHGKTPPSGVWRSHRLEGKVENRGIKAQRKPKQKEGK